jgi:hypothetical protein
MGVNVLEEHIASIMYPEDMGCRFLWNANSPCIKLQYLASQNTVMAVVPAVRTRVSYFLIILSQDLHQQYRQRGMWNQNRHSQKICVVQTGAHLSMTIYKLQKIMSSSKHFSGVLTYRITNAFTITIACSYFKLCYSPYFINIFICVFILRYLQVNVCVLKKICWRDTRKHFTPVQNSVNIVWQL